MRRAVRQSVAVDVGALDRPPLELALVEEEDDVHVVVHARVDRAARHRADVGVERIVEGHEQRREDAAVLAAVVRILVVEHEIAVVVGVVGVHDAVAVGIAAGAVRVVAGIAGRARGPGTRHEAESAGAERRPVRAELRGPAAIHELPRSRMDGRCPAVVENDVAEVPRLAGEGQQRGAALVPQDDGTEVAARRRQQLEGGVTSRGAREPERELLAGTERLADALARDGRADDHVTLAAAEAASDALGGIGHRGGKDGESDGESERAHGNPLSDEFPASIGRNGPSRYAL